MPEPWQSIVGTSRTDPDTDYGIPQSRIWQIEPLPCLDSLLIEITNQTWPGCQGFVLEKFPELLFLNFSFSRDGMPIFAAVYGGLEAVKHYHLDSHLVELWSFDSLRIGRMVFGHLLERDFSPEHCREIAVMVERPEQHRRRGMCPYCGPTGQ